MRTAVVYRPLADLEKALAEIEKSLAEIGESPAFAVNDSAASTHASRNAATKATI